MVALLDLWLPIVLSAVLVFVVSSVIHMLTPMHKKDYKSLKNEDAVLDALRAHGVGAGEYAFPYCPSMKDMGSPEFAAKLERGPSGTMVIRAPGSISIGKSLAQWFVLSLVVATFVAYVTGRTHGPGADPGSVLQIASAVAFAGFGLALPDDSIWKGVSWAVTARFLVDSLLYALVTGLTFRWLWPDGVIG